MAKGGETPINTPLTTTESKDLIDGIMEQLRSNPEEPAKTALEDQLAAAVRDLEHTFIGPTWKMEDGKWILPEHTLGWQILGWCSQYLRDFEDSSKPLTLTPEQVRFCLWWFAVDEDGRFVYRTGLLTRPKGWG